MKEKRTIKHNIIFKEIWDKPSVKGFPTKESVLVTIAIDQAIHDRDITIAGYAIKVPGDEPKPKVGRAIAVKQMYSGIFDPVGDSYEKSVLNFIDVRKIKLSKDVLKRIKNMVCEPEVGVSECNRLYSYSYYPQELTVD